MSQATDNIAVVSSASTIQMYNSDAFFLGRVVREQQRKGKSAEIRGNESGELASQRNISKLPLEWTLLLEASNQRITKIARTIGHAGPRKPSKLEAIIPVL